MRSKKVHVAASTIILTCLQLSSLATCGQSIPQSRTDAIAITARPSHDSITLRWAPTSAKAWMLGNAEGYRIERFVVSRDGKLVSLPEKSVLARNLKPWPEERWEPLVRNYSHAAIAAQALFGDRFEVDLRQNDAFTIVNKVQEIQQRFAFALFSADMSPDVAIASGLWLADTTVRKGEKYLYRIIVEKSDSVSGSIFISPDDPYHLSEPQNLQAESGNRAVSLKWDRAISTPYTAYRVQRSEDGIVFSNISETPLVTMSPEEGVETHFEYAADSLPDTSQQYYYRIKGITPFGEEGPPSAVVNGRNIPGVESIPYVVSAENVNNISILIEWNFNERENAAIEGFSIERSLQPSGAFSPLTDGLLAPSVRSFRDENPGQANYYRVSALGLDNIRYTSPVYFAQLIDSIPPVVPSGLKANISDDGTVSLSWQPNSEMDIYGYRVYRSNLAGEEPAQITTSPVMVAAFTDSVNLKTLNENVYYRVMALDINQNHSMLSGLLEVKLPDKVKPQPAVFLPVRSEREGVRLSWLPAGSQDIVRYKLYRKQSGESWHFLDSIPVASDSVFFYVDKNTRPGQRYNYTLVSVDDAGLESDPAAPVSGVMTKKIHHPPVTWRKAYVNREENQITIAWKYEQEEIAMYRIFKSTDSAPAVLYRSLSGKENQYTDTIIPGQQYSYRIMALFNNGQTSLLSEELVFKY